LHKEAKITEDYSAMTDAIFTAFSKPESLTQSFLKQSCRPGDNPIDLNHVREAFAIILSVIPLD
jgi:hypothetical protein